MKVNINGKEIELKQSCRAMIIYENIMGKSFYPAGITEIVILFYATILASSKGSEISYEDVINYIDEFGPITDNKIITEFTDWLNKTMYVKNDISKKSKLPKEK